MIAEGFGCATNDGAQFRSVDLEARKLQKGLWSEEWADKRGTFPSALCIVSSRNFKRHLQYIRQKSAKQTPPQ